VGKGAANVRFLGALATVKVLEHQVLRRSLVAGRKHPSAISLADPFIKALGPTSPRYGLALSTAQQCFQLLSEEILALAQVQDLFLQVPHALQQLLALLGAGGILTVGVAEAVRLWCVARGRTPIDAQQMGNRVCVDMLRHRLW
jgi:hypothetical protein